MGMVEKHQDQEYTLGDLGRLLKKHRAVAAYTFVFSLLAGLLVVFLMPPLFEGDVRIEVRREGRAPGYSVKSTQPEGFSMVRNLERKEELTTESEVMKSRALIEEVVKNKSYTIEKMDNIRDFRRYVRYTYNWIKETASWCYDETKYALHLSHRPTEAERQLYAYERTISDAASRVKVEPVQESDVLALTFRSSDPVVARDAANEIVQEYLKRRSEARRQRFHGFFTQEASRMADDLHAREQKLDELKNKFGAYSIDDQRRLLLESLTRASDLRKTTATSLARATARLKSLRKQFAEQPEMITASREVGRNPALDEINRKLVELQIRRGNLAQNFREESVAITSIDHEIAAAKKMKESLASTIEDRVTGSINPIHQALKADLLKAEAEVSALEAEQASLRAQVATYSEDLRALSRGEVEIKDLERRVKTEEEAYILYSKNREQARVTDEMAAADLTEVRVVDPARLPLSPVRPRSLMYSGIALGVAVLLAGLAVFLAQFNDRTLSSERQVLELYGLPVLASFPVAKQRPQLLRKERLYLPKWSSAS